MTLREDANRIVSDAITAALPDTAVKKALEGRSFGPGRLVLVALGKAGWQKMCIRDREKEARLLSLLERAGRAAQPF